MHDDNANFDKNKEEEKYDEFYLIIAVFLACWHVGNEIPEHLSVSCKIGVAQTFDVQDHSLKRSVFCLWEVLLDGPLPVPDVLV